METREITFQDIIRLNNHDWDLAYEVLIYQIKKENLIKEILAGDQIIYRCAINFPDHELEHARIWIFRTILTPVPVILTPLKMGLVL
ncbi:hypothetical protein [Algoriphagus chordae]|uniref:Uncharacterized protein n=1 Tax=Algoriphagus chordae TaxID=237019 RepID=A0A2W7SP17_9BACT|nr:hypothetical protein [Algoriphagus chordae]PZX52492.1 hypothetical protein LV85_01793 [Algoriphagus chordae]